MPKKDREAEAPQKSLAAHRQIAPERAVNDLLLEGHRDERRLGEEERIERKNVRQQHFPSREHEKHGAEPKPEAGDARQNSLYLHCGTREVSSSLSTSQMRDLISLNCGVSRIS